jgi:hypothetical protein
MMISSFSGADTRVLTMSFSEFGRRVQSNASAGTDHGTAAPMIVVGTEVQPGIIGTNPSLTALNHAAILLCSMISVRYIPLCLHNGLWVSGTELQTSMLRDFAQLPIIKQSASSVDTEAPRSFACSLSPNPVESTARLQFILPQSADVTIRIRDLDGRVCREVVNTRFDAGSQSVEIPRESLPAGTYFIELRALNHRNVCTMVVL